MGINLNETVSTIKRVGSANTRIVSTGDKCIIEVNENGAWSELLGGLNRKMAEDIVSQAANRVILG